MKYFKCMYDRLSLSLVLKEVRRWGVCAVSCLHLLSSQDQDTSQLINELNRNIRVKKICQHFACNCLASCCSLHIICNAFFLHLMIVSVVSRLKIVFIHVSVTENWSEAWPGQIMRAWMWRRLSSVRLWRRGIQSSLGTTWWCQSHLFTPSSPSSRTKSVKTA